MCSVFACSLLPVVLKWRVLSPVFYVKCCRDSWNNPSEEGREGGGNPCGSLSLKTGLTPFTASPPWNSQNPTERGQKPRAASVKRWWRVSPLGVSGCFQVRFLSASHLYLVSSDAVKATLKICCWSFSPSNQVVSLECLFVFICLVDVSASDLTWPCLCFLMKMEKYLAFCLFSGVNLPRMP